MNVEAEAPPPELDAYDALEGLNWSTLKHMAVSPAMLKWRSEHPREDTSAFERGRWIHCATLESDRWTRSYVPQPNFGDLRFKANKVAKRDWQASLRAGVEIVAPADYELVERCAQAIRNHPAAAKLIETGRVEEIMTWTDEATGVVCKGRVDFIGPRYVLDIKSTRRQTIRQIERDYASLLYHGQLAYYHDGAIASRRISPDAEGPYSIAVQTVEPFDVVPGVLSSFDLERGRELYRSLLRKYLECQAADWWPGLAPNLVTLDLPDWAPGGDNESSGGDW